MISTNLFTYAAIIRVDNGYIVETEDEFGYEGTNVFTTFAEATSYIASGMCLDDNNGAQG